MSAPEAYSITDLCNSGLQTRLRRSGGSIRNAFTSTDRNRSKRRAMKTWFSILFGTFGYLLVVWYYLGLFYPAPEGVRRLLWSSCMGCISITRLGGPPWRGILLFLAPANALAYALAGALLGALILRLKRS